jgi:predicted O-methyltransferase YrrM
MNIKLIKEEVSNISFEKLMPYLPHNQDEFKQMQGEPYSFYAYISTLINNKIILDVGTRTGLSALAFSYNKKNKIISYDLKEQGASNIQKENIQFKIMDFRDDDSLNYNNVKVIMIDVDPHDGVQEREMYDFLKNKNWSGLLILDDILDNWSVRIPGAKPQEMRKWWDEIQEEKYDVSDVAHSSGTGLVNFGNKFKIEIK